MLSSDVGFANGFLSFLFCSLSLSLFRIDVGVITPNFLELVAVGTEKGNEC